MPGLKQGSKADFEGLPKAKKILGEPHRKQSEKYKQNRVSVQMAFSLWKVSIKLMSVALHPACAIQAYFRKMCLKVWKKRLIYDISYQIRYFWIMHTL